MNVKIYKTSDDANVVNKSLTLIREVNIDLQDGIDVQNPVLLLSDMDAANFKDCNYMYIEGFGRYYWIDPVITRVNGLYQVSGKVDVLMSFKSQFLGCSAVISRQEKKYNLYLNDGEFKSYANNKISTKVFPNGFNKNLSYVMLVGGG